MPPRYEGLLVEAQRTESILETQRAALDAELNASSKARAAYLFGSRWALRHQNLELGAQLVEEALKLDPAREEAFTFLRDAYGARGSDWERVISLAEELADRSTLGNGASHLLTQVGLLAWKERGDLIRARRAFERLAGVAPAHPALRAFEAQIGETLSAPSPRLRAVAAKDDAGTAAALEAPEGKEVGAPSTGADFRTAGSTHGFRHVADAASAAGPADRTSRAGRRAHAGTPLPLRRARTRSS